MDLGLERAGMECRFQVEIDPWCREELEKHWPKVKRYGDIRELSGDELEPVDCIAGGFPCVDISAAGQQAGIDAPRSGLWFDMARLVRRLQPRYVLVENVARLLVSGIDRVLGELASCGYDAEWEVLSACSFGAPHPRRRVFIVAYPSSSRLEGIYQAGRRINLQSTTNDLRGHWEAEPTVAKVANGVPRVVDYRQAVAAYGNAVVPQVAEWIGRRIMEAEAVCHG